MNTGILKTLRPFLIIIFLTVLVLPLASAGNYCPHDELKDYGEDDVEWVDFGTGDVPWGKTTMDSEYSGDQIEIEIRDGSETVTVPYVLKVNDFDLAHTQVDLSIAVAEAGAKPVRKVLLLDDDDASWFHLDHELKVELTDITEDSHGTPHAKLKYYERGVPEFEIEIESGSETYEEVSVSEEEYFPGRKKEITVTVRNEGEGWVEYIELEVDIEGFELVDSKKDLKERDIQGEDGHLYANLGWLDEDDERSINFTVRAPAWDGTISPFDMDPCNITARVSGDDILGYAYEGNETLSCTPVSPEPDMNVGRKLSVYSLPLEEVVQANRKRLESNSAGGLVEFSENENELYMSSWHIEDGVVYGHRDYCVVKDSVYNLEDYELKNLTFELPTFPDGLLVAETYKNGRPVSSSNSDGSFDFFGDGVSICIPGKNDYETLDEIVPSSLDGRESYSLGYVLIPIKPGDYKIESFSATSDCYGYDLSDKSDSISFTVHGPDITVSKSIEKAGNGQVNVALRIKNSGDRAASANLGDRIPNEAGLIPDSITIWRNGKLEETDMPLDEWNLETSAEEDSTSVSLTINLPSDEYYDLKYSLKPASFNTLDLPPAEASFQDRNFYKGTVLSPFFKSGAEVRQEWDHYENRWEVTTEHWDASAGDWEKDWDPIAKQWTGEKASSQATSSESWDDDDEFDESLLLTSEVLENKSTFDKIKDFFSGLLPGGKDDSELPVPAEEPAPESSGNESIFDKIKGVFSFLPFFGEGE